jgi:hypothetical protein
MNTAQTKRIARNATLPARRVVNTVTKPEGVVSQFPLSSALIVFGLGLGVGVALGSLMAGPVIPHRSLGQRTELAAIKLGRHVRDTLSGVLPDSVSKCIS